MSAIVELPASLPQAPELAKLESATKPAKSESRETVTHRHQDKHQHPLHKYDLSLMSKFYESCVGKLHEQMPKFEPNEWFKTGRLPSEPLVVSLKQNFYDMFVKFAHETSEPMILMPNFDCGDILNFERFLQSLKIDGVNAIGKYKQYLNNKDMRKLEIDLVVVHPKYGVLLFELKECDHLDNKRRSKAKAQLNNARGCFESMGRLIVEAKGWSHGEANIQVSEFVVLPNIYERPINKSYNNNNNNNITLNSNPNTSASSSSSGSRSSKQLNFVIKQDFETSEQFVQWWKKSVVEPKEIQLEAKANKFDVHAVNMLMGLINCVRNNSIMPVVYSETGVFEAEPVSAPSSEETSEPKEESGEKKEAQFKPALNIHGEFFPLEHELVRSVSKVVAYSSDSEKIRRTICLQALWLLLNDSQRKISVVCSEMNKPYYEEFFASQRKLYNSLNNIRFYLNIMSCDTSGSTTLRKYGETWFFDHNIQANFKSVIEHAQNLNQYWIFTNEKNNLEEFKSNFETMNVRIARLDTETNESNESMPWLSSSGLKFPLRLQCDLLVIGDLISSSQLKPMFRYLKNTVATNNSMHYQSNASNHYGQQYSQQQQQLNFNPNKKFRTVKFIRGGSIDNLRNSLKMHDSIQAQVVLLHVGDEDLFKTRNSSATVERIKELATLVKEYCPRSFVVLSTLMRRMSRTENTVANEVNKGITTFCKQSRDTVNCYYMLNNQFEPDYHTLEGRHLNARGLRLYVDNLLFMVDYFNVKNNKQQ